MGSKLTLFPLPTLPSQISKSKREAVQRRISAKITSDFFKHSVKQTRSLLEKTSAEEWEKMGGQKALQVFHAAAERVPAYKDFLRKHKISHRKIRTVSDLARVPATNKKTYLKKYPFESLCWDGEVENSQMISISSGSTGKPFMWPRDVRLEYEVTYLFELTMESFFRVSKYKTLIIDCFAMGMYVGGPFFLNASLRIAQKGYRATVVTPGNVLSDILRIVTEMAPQYEQIVLSGYPPFLKDVIDEGKRAGIKWEQYRTILFPAGDGFSERWRSLVAESIGANPVTDILGYYGTADAAVLGMETPWSVHLRREIAERNGSVSKVFGQSRLPSFLQYFPTLRYFEEMGNELHFTAANGSIPLIRYNIGDIGGIISFSEMETIAREHGLEEVARQKEVWELPFVYLFGRSDDTAILYGANIYPENIKLALEHKNLRTDCTGRFVMKVNEEKDGSQRLHIYVEPQHKAKRTTQLQNKIRDTIQDVLRDVNAEYTNASRAVGERAIPIIHVVEHGDETYFTRKKQKQTWKL